MQYRAELTVITTFPELNKKKTQIRTIYQYEVVDANSRKELINNSKKAESMIEFDIEQSTSLNDSDYIKVPNSKKARTDYRVIFFGDSTRCHKCREDMISIYSFNTKIERHCNCGTLTTGIF